MALLGGGADGLAGGVSGANAIDVFVGREVPCGCDLFGG